MDFARNDRSDALPFPCALGLDGNQDVCFLTLTNQKKGTLKNWCKEYRLLQTGNIATLTARLVAFSGDWNTWKQLRPGTWRSHKGPRENTKTKNVKLLTSRRQALLSGQGPSDSSDVVMHALPADRSKDTRTQAEINNFIPFFTNIVNMFPYKPPDSNGSMLVPLSNARINTATLSSLDLHRQMQLHDNQLVEIKSIINTICTNQAAQALSMNSQASTSAVCAKGTPPSLTAESQLLKTAVSTPTPLTTLDFHLQILNLGNGNSIALSLDGIPECPSVSFAKDIARLGTIWDDSHPLWSGTSPLNIDGHQIALKYWPKIYRYTGSQQWQAVKGRYFEWKVIAERYLQDGPQDFCCKFSVDGKHMSYTAISNVLQKQRKDDHAALECAAHAEYGNRFNEFFSYRKGGTHHLLVKTAQIAARYQALKAGTPLNDEEEAESEE